jgi:predicted transcriptional regulator
VTKTTVYLDTETALALRQLAGAQGRTQAELIREALARYTEQSAARKPRGIGKYRSGRSDISERAEELLRRGARGRWR